MATPIIVSEHLGKQYPLVQVDTSARGALRFSEMLAARLRKPWSRPATTVQPFWALQDVSFSVEEGEVVGIIGRNGAGKSTLLKILSRITEPSRGRIRLRGRVASLLEVGTGFHPELTGRENIYLNGAILGLRRGDITRQFDAIVDFAGTERFLDTPVKRYSSGMYVRLAFAVAAHLEPEILVIDEVLAVGDSEFQKKCLGKMSQVAQGGRTVLFVSHNLQAVRMLCSTALVLDAGALAFRGATREAIDFYLRNAAAGGTRDYVAQGAKQTPHCRAIRVVQDDGELAELQMHKPISFEIEVDLAGEREAVCTIVISNTQGIWVCHCTDEFSTTAAEIKGACHRRARVPANTLQAGRYTVTVALSSRPGGEIFEKLQDVLTFDVEFTGPGTDRVGAAAFRAVTSPALMHWERRGD